METKSSEPKKSNIKSYIIIAVIIVAGVWGYSLYKRSNQCEAPVVVIDSTATDSAKAPEVVIADTTNSVVDSSKIK